MTDEDKKKEEAKKEETKKNFNIGVKMGKEDAKDESKEKKDQ